MIAVSSVRPLWECPKTRERILAAHRTWLVAFDRIYYFGTQSPELAHPKVSFVISEQFPRIVQIAEFCASLEGWSCIVNGDILVGKELPEAEKLLKKNRATSAMSRRWQFEGSSLRGAKVIDLGLDFFAAMQDTWRKVAQEYPEQYRFGHSSWDSLMLGAFNCISGRNLFDLTPRKLIFHPRHAERRTVFFIPDDAKTRFRDNIGWPSRKL